jgi:hypothetical protein
MDIAAMTLENVEYAFLGALTVAVVAFLVLKVRGF